MSDIIQDVRDYFADRFSSPLWISIVVSWLLINWQIPVTATFETENFGVAYILDYKNKTTHWCLISIPILLGLAYSIFSSSAKETLELLSKTIRGLIAKIDRKGSFYRSISITEHENQLSKLKRQLQRIENDKEQLNEIIAENAKLTEEKTTLTNKSTITMLEMEKSKTENSQTKKEKEDLEKNISALKTMLDDIDLEKNNLLVENAQLIETLSEEKTTKEAAAELNSKITELINEVNRLKDKNQRITYTLKKYINSHPNKDADEIKALIYNLRKNGINPVETKDTTNSPSIKQTYYKTILENCGDQLKEDLKNPTSRASILLVLEVLNGLHDYKPDELIKAAGIPSAAIEKTMQIISDAEWLSKDFFENPELSESGERKLFELKSDNSLSKLKDIFLEIDKESEKNIISALAENHLSRNELKQKINFTPNIANLLTRLMDAGKITKSGKIYFHK